MISNRYKVCDGKNDQKARLESVSKNILYNGDKFECYLETNNEILMDFTQS